jgi:hypothetical protein
LEFPAADSNLTAARAAAEAQSSEAPRLRRLGWAELLRRVFAIDVLACPRCGGRLRLLSAIHCDAASQAILDCL